jgi:hypothetical protein
VRRQIRRSPACRNRQSSVGCLQRLGRCEAPGLASTCCQPPCCQPPTAECVCTPTTHVRVRQLSSSALQAPTATLCRAKQPPWLCWYELGLLHALTRFVLDAHPSQRQARPESAIVIEER